MYDFLSNKENAPETERRTTKGEMIAYNLLEKVFDRNNTYIKQLTYADTVYFYLKSRSQNPKITQCLIVFAVKDGKFDVQQIMLDENGDELRISDKMCEGRHVVADEFDQALANWFEGKKAKILNKETMV